MYRVVVGLSFLCVVIGGMTARVQSGDLERGQALYRQQCSVCHGHIASGTGRRLDPGRPWRALRAVHLVVQKPQLAVAPPYGPPLRGVFGRPAGSVEGFPYSRAFRKAMQGVVWNRQTLDRWITDSQAWVPGSLMFYKQPDPEIRRQIISYLEASR